MSFKNFRLQLILRLALLVLSIYLLAWIGFNPTYRSTFIGLALLVLLQVWLLIRFNERTNKLVLRFLNSINYDDFTEQFHVGGEGKTQRELAKRLNEVMEKFRQVRAEKEAHLHYFEVIVQHIGIGIITYRPDGSILLLNNAAKKLLRVGQLQQVQQLEEVSPELAVGLQQLDNGDKALVPVRQGVEQANLAVHVIELSLLGDRIRLASLQNIQSELEDKEMEAWHNLIKVLTHEIMNSVTPIASLSASAHEEIESYTDTEAEEVTLLREELEDIGQCLHTIHRRSDGLIRFVQDFRNLTTISLPQVGRFDVRELLKEIKTLMREQFSHDHVKLQIEVPPDSLLLAADRSMIEQVLINLVKNALEAVREKKEGVVILRAYHDERSRISLQVADNGYGMTQEAASKIFIPFFTTKKTGSGIGLSLSRQIMRLHKGTISVQSEIGKGTTFTLRF
ncbi:histidine kinase/DNA gyrase B/HSP90-like ATPase [Pontibacter ummariensis]|uniref:histidine kinase n=1 Tax=Pontibacter ummariensis TaxID=1610492 RepID=A0A239C651_9BACT|nr:ATP-binding protein [Pontibacter ummariensis]PRY15423.1 histidine kinase/DNA gyrase B/HSP90-like ATPase [Pontibacter ummariensis]SNS15696.1 Histidine kinase-, DNA gyrase B-, and HSP90-like ATPase [Pontibacter ummariensis]